MKFFPELLRMTTEERRELLGIPVIRAAAAGAVDRQTYIAFLGQAYHHVKHTVPLLMACGARLPQHLGWLRTAIGQYIEEEMGHEEWVLNDIEACGADAEAARDATPALATELMVAYAYDTVQRGNPAGLFGMVHVLEGASIELATRVADALHDTLGLPSRAFSYLRSHGALDVAHVDFFRELMNRLERDEDRQAVVHCARVFYRLYGDIFRSLPRQTEKQEVINATH